MRSILLTIIWEAWRRGRWGLILAAVAAEALWGLLFSALQFDGGIDPADPVLITLHIPMAPIGAFMFIAALFTAQGPVSRFYAFPVRTSALVAWHLFPMLLAVILESLASTAFLNAVFHLGWPLWGPALFAAVALATVQATLWLTEKSDCHVFAFGLVVTALGIWLKSRYGSVFSTPDHFWSTVTAGEIATMLAVVLLAYYVSVLAVARDRCGTEPYSFGFVKGLERLKGSLEFAFAGIGSKSTLSRVKLQHGALRQRSQLPQGSELPQREGFQSALDAQFWLEWQRKGWVLPAVVLFGVVLGVGGWLLGSRDVKDLYVGFVGGGGLLSGVGAFCGMYLGHCGFKDGNLEFGHFLATRPMSSLDMARVILKTAARSVLIAWSIWAGSFLLLYVFLSLILGHTVPELVAKFQWWYLPASLLGFWTTTSLLASAVLAGRQAVVIVVFLFPFAISLSVDIFSKFVLSPDGQQQLRYGVAATCGVLLMLGAALAFVAARRRSLIGSSALWLALCVWGVLSLVVVMYWGHHPTEPLAQFLLLAGLVALPTAPLATAPLALAWNRNR